MIINWCMGVHVEWNVPVFVESNVLVYSAHISVIMYVILDGTKGELGID